MFKDGKSNLFSNLATKLMINAAAIKGSEMKFEVRNIDEVLKDNAGNNSNQ